jgi:hypothetical protein
MSQIGRLPEISKGRFVDVKPEKRCLGMWPLPRKSYGRGRNTGCPVPPAQIPACANNALGSSLEYERQSGNKDGDVII